MPPDRTTQPPDNVCTWCLTEVRPRGMGAHKRFCPQRPQDINVETEQAIISALIGSTINAEQAAMRRAILDQEEEMDGVLDEHEPGSESADVEIGAQSLSDNDGDGMHENMCHSVEMGGPSNEPNNPTDNTESNEGNTGEYALNDIMVVKHPKSKEDPCVYSFEDYYDPLPDPIPTIDESNTSTSITSTNVNVAPVTVERVSERAIYNRLPWRPFRSRLDFELAELIQGTNLNKSEIDTLLAIINRIIDAPHEFSITSFADLSKAWTLARDVNLATGFQMKTFKVKYRDEDLEYEVWMRPLWNWCRDILLDRELISQFTWNAQHLFKFDGERFIRFIDEPWTADAWWEFQTRPTKAPPGSLPFFFLLYADKTRLSSFGTVKGYPVLVRCLNLPVHIRNGTGTGGGHLIGWLPIPDDTAADNRRRKFSEIKRVVWHTAMRLILESIVPYTFVGCTLVCGDDIQRTVLPHALMFSADYEEQAIMSLIRGVNSLKPCPGCYVPEEEMSNISLVHDLRKSDDSKQIYAEAQGMNASDKEEYLKEHGLRDVENAFWTLNGVDVHSALCFDVLHAYDAGLFKTHILEEIKAVINKMGIKATEMVEQALDGIPPWPGLNHFKSIITGDMADGAKFEDLSKVILFATVHVFIKRTTPRGYALLFLLRDYLELRMYASLTVHTEITIEQGQLEFNNFRESLEKYKAATANLEKRKVWDFPKIHTHTHMFRDILEKGVTRNYNTKPNEQANGPLKTIYQQRTNFKDVASQILKVNEMDLIATTIRGAIELFDEKEQDRLKKEAEDSQDSESGANSVSPPGPVNGPSNIKKPRIVVGNDHFELGSALPAQMLEKTEAEKSAEDPVFINFRKRLSLVFSRILKKRIQLDPEHEIIPYQFVKVFYQSVVDLNMEKNILRTNPNFYNKVRYDCALVQIVKKQAMFVRLKYLFSIRFDEKTYYLALVLPMDQISTTSNKICDRKLRLTRVRSRPSESPIFIDLDSIIRGGLLVRDNAPNSSDDEYFVNQFIDQDMWMRLRMGDTELVVNAGIIL